MSLKSWEHVRDSGDHSLDVCTVFSVTVSFTTLFSTKEPTLWVQALTYFASKEICREKISEVLEQIDHYKLLQPLMVVQLLAQYKSV